MGLGLAITKQIINAHGGWIDIHSDPETGNKFSIGIPLQRQPSPVKR
jgi:signal transduction histidine kinase